MSVDRPPCPTCGGKKGMHDSGPTGWDWRPCPDCVDGKVSIEQLVATYNAVHDEPPANAMRTSGYLLEYLMSVKP